jgi:hypothetical protein
MFRPRPALVINPADDVDFREAVQTALADGEGEYTPVDLEAVLKAHYPAVLVRPRNLEGEPIAWYVYRDGHWVRRPGS